MGKEARTFSFYSEFFKKNPEEEDFQSKATMSVLVTRTSGNNCVVYKS
jgi:hypothetical protein